MDLRAVAAFAREHGLVSVVDATFATPVNLRPVELGFDVVLHRWRRARGAPRAARRMAPWQLPRVGRPRCAAGPARRC